MHDISKKQTDALNAINEMCDVLMKATNLFQGVKASPHVPDYTPEQIIQARGSVAPIASEQQAPAADESIPEESAAAAPGAEMPSMAGIDLSQYSPEKLKEFTKNFLDRAMPHLVDVLAHHISQGGGMSDEGPKNPNARYQQGNINSRPLKFKGKQ